MSSTCKTQNCYLTIVFQKSLHFFQDPIVFKIFGEICCFDDKQNTMHPVFNRWVCSESAVGFSNFSDFIKLKRTHV